MLPSTRTLVHIFKVFFSGCAVNNAIPCSDLKVGQIPYPILEMLSAFWNTLPYRVGFESLDCKLLYSFCSSRLNAHPF